MGRWRQFRLTLARGRKVATHLGPDLRRETPLMVAGCIAMIAEIFARLVEPWPLKFVFDHVIDPSAAAEDAPAILTGLSPAALVIAAAIAVVVAALLRGAAAYVSTVAFALAGNRILTAMRSRTFDHLQRLSLRFHDRARTGDLVTRLIGDMGRLQEVVVTALLPMGVHALTLAGMLGLMLWINVELGLIALVAFPLFFLFTVRIGGRIRSVARQQRRREGKMGATAAEAIAAIRTVQAMGLEGAMSDAFGRQNRKSAREGVKAKRLAARLERGVDVLIAGATALVLWRGATLVVESVITPGDLIVFLAYLKNAFKPMRDIAKYAGRISNAMASGERVVELLETPLELVDDVGATDAPEEIRSIAFNNVSFTYDAGIPALSDVTFQAQRGQLIALVGPSGAGKSTLVNLLLRLYDPTSGSVTFDERDIREFKLASLRRQIAIVPQESILFNMSVRDNIALGHENPDDERIRQAAMLAGADAFIRSMPEGYDSIIAERGATLSGGQQRRIAIARAALRDAPILILDEPMAGLDGESRRIVGAAVARLRRDRITFVILHDLQAAADADLILCLDHGRVVERGTQEQLVADNGLYARLLRVNTGEHGRSKLEAKHALGR